MSASNLNHKGFVFLFDFVWLKSTKKHVNKDVHFKKKQDRFSLFYHGGLEKLVLLMQAFVLLANIMMPSLIDTVIL